MRSGDHCLGPSSTLLREKKYFPIKEPEVWKTSGLEKKSENQKQRNLKKKENTETAHFWPPDTLDKGRIWTGVHFLTGPSKKISVSSQNRKFEKFTLAPNTETSNMSLLKKFSKSTQDLREKKKWKMSTFKPKRKEQDYIFLFFYVFGPKF